MWWRPQGVEYRVHAVLQHQLPGQRRRVGGVVAVVEDLVVDGPAEDAPVGVDILEVRTGARRDLRVAGRRRAGERLRAADGHRGGRDAWRRRLVAGGTSATATATGRHQRGR